MSTATTTTPKRKAGRPKTITVEIEGKLLKLISEGHTKTAACRKLGIGSTTVDEKAEADPAFDDRLMRARVRGAWARNDYTVDKLRTATNRNIAVVREQAHHCRWESSKLIPRTFGDRIGIDMQADVRVQREVDDDSLARYLSFAISREAKDAPLEKFIDSQLSVLRLVAEQIARRGGGSLDPRMHGGKFEDIAKALIEIGEIAAKRMRGDVALATPAALPAPAEPVQQPEKEINPAPSAPDGLDSGPSRARARDPEPDVEVI